MANELGCLIDPIKGKLNSIKLFEYLYDNFDDKEIVKAILDLKYDEISGYRNEFKIDYNKSLKCMSKKKSLEYLELKQKLLYGYDNLLRYDLITSPYIYVTKINTEISKISFNCFNEYKSKLHEYINGNKYREPKFQFSIR